MSDTQTTITGLWLRTTLAGRVEILFERDGHWWLAIDEANGDNISHIVEPNGMAGSPPDPITRESYDGDDPILLPSCPHVL
jgi:hypothetical protein